MPNKRIWQWTAAVVALLWLAGCGFQLRGKMDTPPDLTVYIQSNRPPNAPPSELRRTLELILETNGAQVTDDPAKATATVKLLDEDLRRRTIATGPGGEVREYELRYTVDYAVSRADGSQAVPRSTAIVFRDLLYSETEVLGRAAGEEIVVRDMVSDVAYSILRRLIATV